MNICEEWIKRWCAPSRENFCFSSHRHLVQRSMGVEVSEKRFLQTAEALGYKMVTVTSFGSASVRPMLGLKHALLASDHFYRGINYESKYGITFIQFGEMLREHDGLCWACREPGLLVVDHCHDTLRVRGLLCDSCNKLLGKLEAALKRNTPADRAMLLKNAERYLQVWRYLDRLRYPDEGHCPEDRVEP